MKVSQIIKTGIISTMLVSGVTSCKKVPFSHVQKTNLPKEVTGKLDSLSLITQKIKNDKTYYHFGNDTLEITDKLTKKPAEYLKKLNNQAIKNTPTVKTGTHTEIQMIPKTGGGFTQIFVVKPTKEPKYIEQKAVINPENIYTRDGKDYYVPVEYYGKHNPKISEK